MNYNHPLNMDETTRQVILKLNTRLPIHLQISNSDIKIMNLIAETIKVYDELEASKNVETNDCIVTCFHLFSNDKVTTKSKVRTEGAEIQIDKGVLCDNEKSLIGLEVFNFVVPKDQIKFAYFLKL